VRGRFWKWFRFMRLGDCKCCERVWESWGAAGKSRKCCGLLPEKRDRQLCPGAVLRVGEECERDRVVCPAFPTSAKTESGKESGNGGGNWESRGFVEFIWFVFAELEGMMVWRLEMD